MHQTEVSREIFEQKETKLAKFRLERDLSRATSGARWLSCHQLFLEPRASAFVTFVSFCSKNSSLNSVLCYHRWEEACDAN
jgi:hypothetical protein